MTPSPYAMQPDVVRTIQIDETLSAISNRICNAEPGVNMEINYLINDALGLPQTCSLMNSLDDSLRVLRERFPQPDWRYGFQDAGYKGYTGPTAWLANGRPQKYGFDNKLDLEYRYYERSARTIEAAFAALVLHACAYR